MGEVQRGLPSGRFIAVARAARSVAAFLVALPCLVSCSGDGSGPIDPPSPGPGSFTLAVSPSTVTLDAATSGDLTITITRSGGFAGAVSVAIEGLPAGVTASNLTIPGTSESGVLALTAPVEAEAGQAQATLRGSTSVTGVDDRTATVTVTVIAANPAPVLMELTPNEAMEGDPAFTLTLTGDGFIAESVVHWNGEARPTTFVSETELTAEIPAADIADPGTVEVTVVNPTPGGGTSSALPFMVTAAPPVVAEVIVAPEEVTLLVGETEQFIATLRDAEGNELTEREVVWASSDEDVVGVDASGVVTAVAPGGPVTITARSEGQTGTAAVTVTTPNPAPVLTEITPDEAIEGGAAFTLSVTGEGFIAESVVRWNGEERPTTFVSETELSAAIRAEDIVEAGTVDVTVVNPTPGGGTSSARSFVIEAIAPNPVPVLAGLAPEEAIEGGAAFTLSVTGEGFNAESVVRWNGAARPTTFVSETELMAAIPAEDIAEAGTVQVTVVNPTPGGGTSSPRSFVIEADDLDLDLTLDYRSLSSAQRTALTGLDDTERAGLHLWKMQVLAVGKNNGGIYFNVINNPGDFTSAQVDLARDLYLEEMAGFGGVNGKRLDQHFFTVMGQVTGESFDARYANAPTEFANGPVNLNNILTGANGLGGFTNAVIRLRIHDLLDNGAMDGSVTEFTLLSPFALDPVDGSPGSLDVGDVLALLAADLASGIRDGTPLGLAFWDALDAVYFGGPGSSIAAIYAAAGINASTANAIIADWAARRGYDP